MAPEGPLGGPRPAARAEVVVYSRFRMGGDVHSEETEPLQMEGRFSVHLEDRLMNSIDGIEPEVVFHPAGFIVGVEVFTNRREIGRNIIDEIVRVSRDYLEDILGANADLEPASRSEEAVEVRAR